MTSAELSAIVVQLGTDKPIFTNEAEFQLNLGIRLGLIGYDVGLERRRTISVNGQMIDICVDIIITREGVKTAIELKYIPHDVFLQHDGETYRFPNNGGSPNLYRFGVLKDLHRVSRLVSEGQVHHGYSICVSNDSRAWQRNTIGDPKVLAAAFSLHQGRVLNAGDILNWSREVDEKSAGGGGVPPNVPLNIARAQTLDWKNFSSFPGLPYGTFKFLLLKG